MRHCNSIFNADNIWFLVDKENETKRKLYIANCPICQKEIAKYCYFNEKTNKCNEKYYYSGGARRIKERFKKEISTTMLDLANKYKMPFGYKYGINKEIRKNGKIIGIRQYASDFYGNKILIKQIKNG